MRRGAWVFLCAASSLAIVGWGVRAQAPEFVWDLPTGFPASAVPADNPMSNAKVALGRHLFYDNRLSGNATQSCATCHQQAHAFTDGRARSVGSTGEAHPRGSMSLANVAYSAALNWANPTLSQLEDQASSTAEAAFHNTALYNLPSALSYPAHNTGVHEFTGRAADVGRFKAPTLRNIAVTAPCMHDGSVGTLTDVIDHYAAGGRAIADGDYAGVGHDNPNRSPTVRGFALTLAERDDLIAFLESLVDEQFLRDERFSDPTPR